MLSCQFCAGRKPSSRRCTHDASPTAATMFDKCKFSLHPAFKISTPKKGMSSLEFSRESDLRQKTCRAFKWKIQQAMRSSKQQPLSGTVHVDGFYAGVTDHASGKEFKPFFDDRISTDVHVVTDIWKGYLQLSEIWSCFCRKIEVIVEKVKTTFTEKCRTHNGPAAWRSWGSAARRLGYH